MNSQSARPWCPLKLLDASELLQRLIQLRRTVVREGDKLYQAWKPNLKRRSFQDPARNLAHYLVLRHHDLRDLQTALMPWGLSSLGRLESRVLPNLDAVIATLGLICREPPDHLPSRPSLVDFFAGAQHLQQASDELFGPPRIDRRVRILVTLPTAAATDAALVEALLAGGADCVRINCAHDRPDQWAAMIAKVRQAAIARSQSCKILMDLGGPKPRLLRVIPPNQRDRLCAGDFLLLTAHLPLGEHATWFQAQCSIPEILDQIQPGDRVWIDDGKIGAVVELHHPEGVLLRIVRSKPQGRRLKVDKGLNFPDSELAIAALTPKDLQDLDFVARHADLVGYSFVQSAADMAWLQQELALRRASTAPLLPIIAKIETPKAVRNLPEMIVQAAGQHPLGIMIARGDLAIEMGYQRLAEMQEEILWICEAAQVPVIWATQVLENLAKTGIPSRAEMSDVVLAERAECVMLNKGPFMVEAVKILEDVLHRMQAHQSKKTPQLRALKTW
ncbi:pyruvate kinase [Lyngbya confervoides]|uniref:Pyruvate kinase n=1 Tax=Lyngbya confervoides BDU141951 TaxID=1574623 RepID=A0ABD4T5J7_9CYAN|nr:pyruvate kinase [Lyngbya confervoides]MCM1983987.1 pyruvate kinase [Lyngbya confervoides BDU141951]